MRANSASVRRSGCNFHDFVIFLIPHMNSMTGYGRGEAAASGTRCVVECASVNRKGLEVACQLPRELAALVVSIRDAVSRRIARGRVNVGITLAATGASATAEIDRPLVRDLLREIRSLQKELSLAGELDVNTLLALPGVIRTPQHTAADYEPLVLRALEPALDALAAMRAKEGKSLQRDFTKRWPFSASRATAWPASRRRSSAATAATCTPASSAVAWTSRSTTRACSTSGTFRRALRCVGGAHAAR